MVLVEKIKNENYSDLLSVYKSDKISYITASKAKVLPFLLRGWAEVLDNQTVYNKELSIKLHQFVGFTTDNRIVWIESSDEKILGAVCYEYKEKEKYALINMSFTINDERKKGINKLCYKVLEKDCKELGAYHIQSYVNVKNNERLDSFTSIGMVPTHYKMFKKLY